MLLTFLDKHLRNYAVWLIFVMINFITTTISLVFKLILKEAPPPLIPTVSLSPEDRFFCHVERSPDALTSLVIAQWHLNAVFQHRFMVCGTYGTRRQFAAQVSSHITSDCRKCQNPHKESNFRGHWKRPENNFRIHGQ